MDTIVRARFFRASEKPKDAPLDLPDFLLSEMSKSLSGRERDITGTGVVMRVEECEADGDFVAGQFCRKQMSNIPPQAGPDGLAPILLEGGHGLGHLAAFRYHRPTRVILLQQNVQSASTKRISLYLAAANGASLFSFDPVLREDALERFKDKRVRSFTVGFASTRNLQALDDSGITSAKGARLLAEAFKGLDLTITVKAGRGKKRWLDYLTVNREITGLLEADADVDRLEVLLKNHDDSSIDFLQEHLKATAELDLPQDDLNKHYAVRRTFLASEFGKRLEYLINHYGG